jgi:hypothetical protein
MSETSKRVEKAVGLAQKWMLDNPRALDLLFSPAGSEVMARFFPDPVHHTMRVPVAGIGCIRIDRPKIPINEASSGQVAKIMDMLLNTIDGPPRTWGVWNG